MGYRIEKSRIATSIWDLELKEDNKFQQEKMCCVTFKIKKSIDFNYYIKDHKFLEATEQADLGIIISNDLKPSKHIDIAKVASKANQRLGMIRRCFSNHSSDVIKPLYQAIVRPIIEYCITALFGIHGFLS